MTGNPNGDNFEGQQRLSKIKGKIISGVAIAMALYHLLYISHFYSMIGITILVIPHNAVSLSFLLVLVFLSVSARKGKDEGIPWYDIFFVILSLIVTLYPALFWERESARMALDNFYYYEHIFALITIILVLEATRRVIGLPMALVASVFLLHTFFGRYLPGVLYVPPTSIPRATELLVFSVNGVYGIAYQTVSTIVIMFIIFGAFLFVTGVGEYFINIAKAAFGKVRGGPAKIATIASGLFGMISGATTANIAVTGVFTIRMMKNIGYKPEFAAAVETVASNGGQIMPPVMGVVAFLMSEWLQIPYWNICVAGALPAFLYYYALFVMVDAEAGKLKLFGLPRNECPPLGKTILEGWYFIMPIATLLYFIGVEGYTPELSALYALLNLLVLFGFKQLFRLKKGEIHISSKLLGSAIKGMGLALKKSSLDMLPAGGACACAGIIIGTLGITQVGLKMSDGAVMLAGGNMFLLLLFSAIVSCLLGMGMSSIPCYIMVVIVIAPILESWGVPALAAHMFAFWFAIVSFITPPVAIGAYVAAGIAGANPMKTGYQAMLLAFTTYIIPFLFVYSPSLLLMGPFDKIIIDGITAVIGVTLVGWGLIGESFWEPVVWSSRILIIAGGFLLMVPVLHISIIGFVVGGVGLTLNMIFLRKRAREELRA